MEPWGTPHLNLEELVISIQYSCSYTLSETGEINIHVYYSIYVLYYNIAIMHILYVNTLLNVWHLLMQMFYGVASTIDQECVLWFLLLGLLHVV